MATLLRPMTSALAILLFLSGCSGPQTPETTTSPPPTTSAATPTTTPSRPTPDLPDLPRFAKLADLPAGHISDIAFSPNQPSRAWLACNVNALGIWRSDDAGNTWTRVFYDETFGATHTNSLALHPTDPNFVLAVDLHGRITRTTDGGATWNGVYEEPISLWSVAIAASGPDRAYVGTDEGDVLRSLDAGATWSLVGHASERPIGALAVDPDDPTHVLAGSANGLHESQDGGATWQKTYPASGDVEVVEFAIDPQDSSHALLATVDGIYETRASGASWTRRLAEHTHTVAFAPSDPREVYAGTPQGIYRSHDGGTTWTSSTGTPDAGALAVHPTDANLALAGTNIWQWSAHGHEFPVSTEDEGLYRTSDGGVAWTRIEGGLREVDVIAVATHPQDPALVIVGTECSRGVFRTRSGGTDWDFIQGGPDETFDIAHYTMQIAFAGDGTLYLTGRFGMATSDDQGESWRSGFARRHVHGVAPSPHDPDMVLAGTSPKQDPTESDEYAGGRIVATHDGGHSWSESGSGFPQGAETSVHAFAFDRVDADLAYAATTTYEFELPPTPDAVGIYKSQDGGQTWVAANAGVIDLNVNALATAPGRAGFVLAGTETGLLRSDDAGDSWQAAGLPREVHAILVEPNDPDAWWAGTREGLYFTTDAGTNWNQAEDIPTAFVPSLATDEAGTILYAAVNGHGVYAGTTA